MPRLVGLLIGFEGLLIGFDCSVFFIITSFWAANGAPETKRAPEKNGCASTVACVPILSPSNRTQHQDMMAFLLRVARKISPQLGPFT